MRKPKNRTYAFLLLVEAIITQFRQECKGHFDGFGGFLRAFLRYVRLKKSQIGEYFNLKMPT